VDFFFQRKKQLLFLPSKRDEGKQKEEGITSGKKKGNKLLSLWLFLLIPLKRHTVFFYCFLPKEEMFCSPSVSRRDIFFFKKIKFFLRNNPKAKNKGRNNEGERFCLWQKEERYVLLQVTNLSL
jgi:hypothetical protein